MVCYDIFSVLFLPPLINHHGRVCQFAILRYHHRSSALSSLSVSFRAMPTSCSNLNPPPPPLVFVATASFAPSAEYHGFHVLRVDVGDKFGEVKGSEENEHWLYAVRIWGHHLGHEAGWVARDILALHGEVTQPRPVSIDMEVTNASSVPSPSFSPFLGNWHACLKMLSEIDGLWEDDRGRNARPTS